MEKISTSVLLLTVFLSACHHSDETTKMLEHDMSRATIDIELPTTLWDRIDAVYQSGPKPKSEGNEDKKPEGKKENKAEVKSETETGDPLADEVTKEYVPLTVTLVEKPDNKGILQSHDHQLFFGRGGGVIDLADFVENRRGSYYLKVIFGRGKPEDEKEDRNVIDLSKESVKVFYLSNSRRRRWNGKIIGSGCTKYFDIASFFEKSMKGPGFLLNTTDHLDVTSLSGSFFFAAQVNKTLYISELSIKDSRFHPLQCRPMLSKVESL